MPSSATQCTPLPRAVYVTPESIGADAARWTWEEGITHANDSLQIIKANTHALLEAHTMLSCANGRESADQAVHTTQLFASLDKVVTKLQALFADSDMREPSTSTIQGTFAQ
eukprot:Sspe_Gene.94022::Locus_66508_Transcript_2_2_Confidence_0.286_Length_450::g.94022::m.94022